MLSFLHNNLYKKKFFTNTIRVSNDLDPDQDRRSVGPDLDPNCFQRLSADDKVAASSDLAVEVVQRLTCDENPQALMQ